LNPSSAVLTALLIQQGLFALLWVVLGALRMARRSAWHWALGVTAVTGGLSLIVLRDVTPRWLGFWLSCVLLYGGFVLLWRGTEIFARKKPADRAHAIGFVLYCVLLAWATWQGPAWTFVSVGSAPLGYVLWRTAWTVQSRLRDEFGAPVSVGCAMPFWLIGLVLLLRGTLAPFVPQLTGTSVHSAGAGNLGTALVFVGCGLVINLGLVALVTSRMLRRLQRASDHDGLTGLLNRRGIHARLLQESRRLARHGAAYSVLSIDIDHFKRINDQHGHPAGDAVLQALGRTLVEAGRDVDLAARAGGEEFWILLPGTTADGARRAADRLLQAVRDMRVQVAGADRPLTLTVSIGIVTADRPNDLLEAVMQRLDAALYRAKQAGRDRIEAAQGVAASNAPQRAVTT